METPSLVLAVSKLAAAGEQAGFTLEQMIELLDHGLEVQNLLEMIQLRLCPIATPPDQVVSRYRWLVKRLQFPSYGWAAFLSKAVRRRVKRRGCKYRFSKQRTCGSGFNARGALHRGIFWAEVRR
jgi:hypothetical protein